MKFSHKFQPGVEIQGRFCKFRVHKTVNPRYYIFDVIDRKGRSIGVHIPVRKAELKITIQKRLAKKLDSVTKEKGKKDKRGHKNRKNFK
jgi:hypothetical protein